MQKILKRSLLATLIGLPILFVSFRTVYPHCEIPCGIYGDVTQFGLLYENITTIEKSMQQIIALSKAESAHDSTNHNQLARWVTNKEEHATKIQTTVMQYFMTQRIKPKETSDEKYVKQITLLHKMLVHAMKAKQTTDLDHVKHLRDLLTAFAESYLTAQDLEHLKKHHRV